MFMPFFIHFIFFLAYTFNNARIDSVVVSQYSPVDKQAMPCKFITLYLQGPGRREVMPKTGNSLKKWRWETYLWTETRIHCTWQHKLVRFINDKQTEKREGKRRCSSTQLCFTETMLGPRSSGPCTQAQTPAFAFLSRTASVLSQVSWGWLKSNWRKMTMRRRENILFSNWAGHEATVVFQGGILDCVCCQLCVTSNAEETLSAPVLHS